MRSVMRLHRETAWLPAAKWIGTGAGVMGAVMIALNISISGYGFVLFLVSSLLWGAAGLAQRDDSLVILQATFTVINLIGIYRWIGV